jgi:hypothetical protein
MLQVSVAKNKKCSSGYFTIFRVSGHHTNDFIRGRKMENVGRKMEK